MPNRLDKEFYMRPATEIAPLLLDKLLCRRTADGVVRRRITETECYSGEDDTACHASRGKTKRTSVMYEAGGVAYIYLCYGIHYLLNVVTGGEGRPEAVLIRGVDGAAGPGLVTKALLIDKSLNAENLCASDRLWIEDDGKKSLYETSKRIGIGYADEADRNRLWRFRKADTRRD
jgi:DNA-3-methyladenine glycosylase